LAAAFAATSIALFVDWDPLTVAFTVSAAAAILIAAPLVHTITSAATSRASLLSPVVIGTAAFVVIGALEAKRPLGAPGLAALVIIILSGWSAILAGGTSPRSWELSIAAPSAIFMMILVSSNAHVIRLRKVTERILVIAVVIQAVAFINAAHTSALSLSFVRSMHTDTTFWATAGAYSFGNPNNASVIYATAFGFGMAGLVGSGRHAPLRYWVLTSLALLDLFDTGSRGAFVCVAAVVVVALLGRTSSRRQAGRLMQSVWPLVVTLASFAILALLAADSSPGAQTSFLGRYHANLAGLTLIGQHLLLGSGPGNAVPAVEGVSQVQSFFGSNTFGSAHDLFINFGVDTGAVALALLLYLVIGGVMRNVSRPQYLAAVPLVALSLSGIAAGIDVVSPSNPSWAFLFMIVLAFAWRPAHARSLATDGSSRTDKRPRHTAVQPRHLGHARIEDC
jgi:hypothetical protein